jgi:aspartate aminotransferase
MAWVIFRSCLFANLLGILERNMSAALLSPRMALVRPSPTLAVTDNAKALKAKGLDVIVLAQGEPDMDTPANICEAGIAAIRAGQTRYTAVNGTVELKKAIAAKFLRDHAMKINPDDVIIGTGGKQVLFNALVATLGEGDEVLIPAPCWVSYPDMAILAGGKVVTVACGAETNFKITPAQLDKAITPRTRWLILNSPSNPTGSVYTEQELRDLGDVLKKHPNVLVMVDDMYEKLLFDGTTFCTLAQAAPDIADRILTVNGVSKAYCMTGWRIGYGHGPSWLIAAMSTIQSQSTSNPSSISQAAAVEALNGPQDFIAKHNVIFQRRRDMVVRMLNECPGITCLKPQGAFYVYPSCAGTLGKTTPKGKKINTDLDFATALLDEKLVAVVPGEAFGLAPYFRISYATSDAILEDACNRIHAFCASLT